MLGLWQATAFVIGPVIWALAASLGIFIGNRGPGGHLGPWVTSKAHGKPSCGVNSEKNYGSTISTSVDCWAGRKLVTQNPGPQEGPRPLPGSLSFLSSKWRESLASCERGLDSRMCIPCQGQQEPPRQLHWRPLSTPPGPVGLIVIIAMFVSSFVHQDVCMWLELRLRSLSSSMGHPFQTPCPAPRPPWTDHQAPLQLQDWRGEEDFSPVTLEVPGETGRWGKVQELMDFQDEEFRQQGWPPQAHSLTRHSPRAPAAPCPFSLAKILDPECGWLVTR